MKIYIILKELGLDYETKMIDLQTEVKAKPYTDINPNGRYVGKFSPMTKENVAKIHC